MDKKSIEDISVSDKKVLVRCDFNVPFTDDGAISNDKRIIGALATIKYLLSKNAKVILCSHLGRPKGEFNKKYSLAPVAKRLSGLLGQDVKMASDVIGESAKTLCREIKPGEVVLLENLRFHKEEEKNDPAFSKELANLAEIYVNDAFGTAHRAHASTYGVAKFLPAVCGFLIKREIEVIGSALDNPGRPFIAILGGAKVSDKIGVIENLLNKVDGLIIGGAMAYTFIKAKGYEIGDSLCEHDKLSMALQLMDKAKQKGVNFYLPLDAVVADKFDKDAASRCVDITKMPKGCMGLDIGPQTQKQYTDIIKSAKLVIWNGPMGVFEFEKFAGGTKAVAKALSQCGAATIIGGGDSAAAVEMLGYGDKMTHISTGGGATLKYLEGAELPGIAALMDK